MSSKTYYLLTEMVDEPETGNVWPQIRGVSSTYNLGGDKSIFKLKPNVFPDFEPDFDSFVLSAKAKRTDFLSQSLIGHSGFLISPRVQNVFLKFRIPEMLFFEVSVVEAKKQKSKYFWAHIKCELYDMIDFQKTSFITKNMLGLKGDELEINSIEDYKIKREEITKSTDFVSQNLYLNNDNILNLDLIRIGLFDKGFYISEGLREELIRNKITGAYWSKEIEIKIN